jgi:phosphatidylglycerophosphate synthase
MASPGGYSYQASVKSGVSDELINIYAIRPAAGLLVRMLYPTSITPNHVTVFSTLVGLVAAVLYLANSESTTVAAGLCITAKDLLDSADGQLARAKAMYSRIGRFLDSIGDFIVNLAVFVAIGFVLTKNHGAPAFWLLALAGFLGISLRVSYHVFYQTAFLHLEESYATNRLTEEIREEDLHGDPRVLLLQRLFRILYGWQDALMLRIDHWSRGTVSPSVAQRQRWHADAVSLRLSGLLGMGTELFLLTLCSLARNLECYLWLNLLVMNGVWGLTVLYRRVVLRPRVFGAG